MWFYGAHIATMGGWDKDCATRVSSLTDEEPLVVVKAGVDIVGKVVRKDRSDGCDSVIGEGEAPLHRGGRGSVCEGAFGAKHGDVGRGCSGGSHRGSKVFSMRGRDEDVVGVNGDVFVEWSKEESVEDFLGNLRGSGRHGG